MADTALPDGKINLTQACEIFDIAEPTFRKLLKRPNFPVEKTGKNGVEYEFDAYKLRAWFDAEAQREKDERAAEKARLGALQLQLFGGTVGDEEKLKLTPADRLKLVQAEQAEVVLQQRLGNLVNRAEYQAATEQALTMLQREILGLVDFVAREFSLDRAQRHRVEDRVEASLRRCADRLKDPNTYGASNAA